MGPSSRPPSPGSPPQALRKRPWYLTLALALAWMIGLVSGMGAFDVLSGSRLSPGEISLDVDRRPGLTESQRARLKDTLEEVATTFHGARNRILPLEVAELLVGMGMFVFAPRAAAGRGWGRQALVQLTVAHVALLGLTWALTQDVRRSELDVAVAWFQMAANVPEAAARSLTSLVTLGVEIARIATGALIVVGLTLPRSRAFYESVPELAEP